MTDTRLQHKRVAVRETDDVKFIPYTRHVDDTVVALEDGSLMRLYRRRTALRDERYRRPQHLALDTRALAIMADKCRDFETLLADAAPEPLSLYEHDGILFSKPMEVLHFILTGDRIRVPLLDGRLGQALYQSRVVFGREAAEIRLPHKSHYLGMFGVREYVASTRTGQFNSLLKLDFPFVLTQSFAPLVKQAASERFSKKYKQMTSSDDAGVSQAIELLDGQDELMANRFVGRGSQGQAARQGRHRPGQVRRKGDALRRIRARAARGSDQGWQGRWRHHSQPARLARLPSSSRY
jgi:type IV secretory pathway VirB4 component